MRIKQHHRNKIIWILTFDMTETSHLLEDFIFFQTGSDLLD